jgi:hypothetical protein
MRWVRYVVTMWKIRNVYKILFGRHKGKRLLGGPRCKCEDNIIMYLRELGCKGVDWIHVAQVWDWWCAVMKTVMNL